MKFKRENTFPVLLQKYFDIYLPISRRMSENTIKSYRSALRSMFRYLEDVRGIPQEKVDFHILNQENLFGYIDWLVSDMGCSISTRNHHLSVLISFAQYAREANYDSAWGFRNLAIKIPFKYFKRKERPFFSARELEILLSLPDQSDQLGYRNYVLLALMYASGMTVKEICNLKFKHVRNVLKYLDDIDSKESEEKFVYNCIRIEIPEGNGRCRSIPVSKAVSRIIKDYIVSKNSEFTGKNLDEQYFFKTRTFKQMTTSCVEEIFKKYLREAESLYPRLFAGKKYSPYTMRHTTAMHLKEMGVKLDWMMMFLGHKSIHSTEVYYKNPNSSFPRYYDNLNDNSNFKSENAYEFEEGDSSEDRNRKDEKSIDTWNKIWLVSDIVDFR